jgi:hypothetical protein
MVKAHIYQGEGEAMKITDKMRLDWLNKNAVSVWFSPLYGGWDCTGYVRDKVAVRRTPRQAIDRAIRIERESK